MLFNAPPRRKPELTIEQYTEEQVRNAITKAIGQICTTRGINLYAWEIEDAADTALLAIEQTASKEAKP